MMKNDGGKDQPAGMTPGSRRQEVETARRSAGVQSFRGALVRLDQDDEVIRLMAEAIRKVLRGT
ncbi:MAG: hypothetical protein GC191_01220 [Azospirillum sp.]|nr:hypothetical protein [Azospirillum sp.]